MLRHTGLDSPCIQYFIGLCINLLVIVVLLNSDTTYNNLQLPVGQYQNNIWKGTDSYPYVKLAKNYLEYGVVGKENIPASNRTIGYPLYLALMMKLFGKNWLMVTFFFQAVLFAFIYPVFTKIIQLIFGDNKRLISWSFLFLLVSGVYFSYVTVLLTDSIFTLFLTIGIYFGLAAIVKQNWLTFLLQIVFIGIAGQIRPILFLYVIPNLFILIAVAKKHNILGHKRVKNLIISSTILLLLICNLPTLRNYINYDIITPATVLQNNMFQSHATKILLEEDQSEAINELYSQIDTTKELKNALKTKLNSAIEVYKEYPFLALKLFTINVTKMLAKNHYNGFANFWGYNWTKKNSEKQAPLKKSNFIFFVTIISGLIYSLMYLLLVSFLIRLIKMKKYLYLICVLIFILYFILPAGFVSEDIRFRLPIEGFLVIFSLFELQQLIDKKFWFKKVPLVTNPN